jgi:serine/threonine protein kinase
MGDTPVPIDDSREVRLGRILSSVHERQARGEAVDTAGLLAAHPDLADELRPYLVTLKQLRSAKGSLRNLIGQGILAASPDPDYHAVLGPYKIIEMVGRGGMGIVLKAREDRLNRIVAVKLLQPDLADDITTLQRFHREAKAAAALRHPNIVTIYAVGDEGGTHYIAMEYIDGPTLAQVVQQAGPLPTETVRSLFRQLLAGLAAAHAAGLIHRDIKSANLLLDQSPQPSLPDKNPRPRSEGAPENPGGKPAVEQSATLKIADFGLARLASARTRLTLPQSAFGTPEYMSPEQTRGEDNVDHRSDLYSAGVVLYEMLTGRTPFRADSPSVVIHRILNEDVTDPRKIDKFTDAALSSLATRLMAKRPEDRFPTAEAAMEALEAGGRISSPARRRKRRRALAATLGLTLLLATGIWLRSPEPIAAVRVAEGARAVEARRGKNAQLEIFHDFPAGTNVTAAVLAAPSQGPKVIAAGVSPARNGRCLFAFDLHNQALWDLDISEDHNWPDCSSINKWMCVGLVAGDVDGQPGDELVVLAQHANEYPTRISIVDPQTHRIRATFWHTGHIAEAPLQPDFFDGHRPAIVAFGLNNKLDGFYESQPGDDLPRTKWDIVSVVMILDPKEMLAQGDSLSPPRSNRLPMPMASAHAYAFLDLSEDGLYAINNGQQEQRPAPADGAGRFNNFRLAPDQPNDDTAPWFCASFVTRSGDFPALVTMDRNLEIRRVLPTNSPATLAAQADRFWRARWKVIIRHGQYVDEQIGDPKQATD